MKLEPQQTKRLKLVKNPSSFDLIIPENVEATIRHLCNSVHDVEWSGTLFYKAEGSLDEGTFKATCLDICVMDIGTTGYTEFKDTADILSYRIEHNLLGEGIYEALIHSHNNMSAFFSGTDDNTLIDEGSDLKHFLSLVVCNAGNYVARITRKLSSKTVADAHVVYTTTSQYDTYGGRTIILKSTSEEKDIQEVKEESVIEYFELNIHKEPYTEPFAEVDERLREIKRNKRPSFQNQGFSFPASKPANITPLKTEAPTESRQLHLPGLEEEKVELTKPQEDEAFYDGTGSPFEGLCLYMTEKVPDKIINNLSCQLLCGCLFANPETINLNTWVNKLDKLYEQRFGDFLTDSYAEFRIQNWIQCLADQLLTFSVDEEFENSIATKYNIADYEFKETDEFTCLYAYDLISNLELLPDSAVKDLIIETLKSYLPVNYDSVTLN